MKSELLAEVIKYDNLEIEEFNLEKIDLEVIELERKRVKNVREKTALLINLIDSETEVFYSYPPRPKFEVLGGHKIAVKRGANLNEVKVYNLYFRFKKYNLNGTSTALMFRDHEKIENILLLPDDTKNRIVLEIRKYLDVAKKLVFNLDPTQQMDPNDQDFLLENLRLLNVTERCAQSLLHEYGHVLHWRIFEQRELDTPSKQFRWFWENGYAENLSERFPGFQALCVDDMLYYLKESFVEDYRIWLNTRELNGKYLLPNLITFVGDFINPIKAYEGVGIMARMLETGTIATEKRSSQSNREPNRLHMTDRVMERFERFGVGSKMSNQDYLDIIHRLEEQEKHNRNLTTC